MKRLVGRKIVKVDLNPQTIQGVKLTSPVLTLDDGTALRFVAEESPDGGEYGVAMVRSGPTDS